MDSLVERGGGEACDFLGVIYRAAHKDHRTLVTASDITMATRLN